MPVQVRGATFGTEENKLMLHSAACGGPFCATFGGATAPETPFFHIGGTA